MTVSGMLVIIYVTVMYIFISSATELCKVEDIYLTKTIIPQQSSIPPNVTKYTIIGLFPGMLTLKTRYNKSGFTWMEVAKYALQEINNMLRHMKVPVVLELIIYDTCNSVEIANAVLLEIILNAPEGTSRRERCCELRNKYNILGLVGPASSTITAQVEQLLSPFNMPVISYSATSIQFDNKKTYPYFMRTIPPDNFQAKLILDLALQFNWTYVSIIANDNEYGRMGRSELNKLFSEHKICTAVDRLFIFPINTVEINDIIDEVKKEKSSNVIILWASGSQTELFLNLAAEYKLFYKTWVVTESVGKHPNIVKFNKNVVQGLLSVVPFNGIYKDFEENFRKINYNSNMDNLGLKNFFEYSLHLTGKHLMNATIEKYWDEIPLTKNGNIRNALYAYGHAIKNYVVENAQCHSNICTIAPILNETIFFYNYLQRVKFKGLSGETVSFDQVGNINSAQFHIYSLQPGESQLQWKNMGIWNQKDGMQITNQKLFWAKNETNTPTSKCADLCTPGFYTIYHGSKQCCWSCIPCSTGYYQPLHGQRRCIKCPFETIANIKKSSCLPVRHIFIKYNSEKAHVLYVLITVTMLSTTSFIILFFVYRKTPIVISSQYIISMLQLLSLLLLPISTLSFIGYPNGSVCIARVCTTGVLMSFIYAFTIVKTQRLIKIFRSNILLSSMRNKILSTEIWIILLTLSINFVIIIAHYIYQPFKVIESNIQENIHVNCNIASVYFSQMSYGFILSLFCGVQAFRARKLPQNYNETTLISFAMFSSSLMVIIFFPLYESAENDTDASFTKIIMKIITANIVLFIMYSYKAWIILFRPKENTFAAFQENRLRSIEKQIYKRLQHHRMKPVNILNGLAVPNVTKKSVCGEPHGLQIHSSRFT